MDLKKLIADGGNAMKKAVDHTSHEFATLHTGKASPGMIENIQVHVEAYGMTQRLKDMAAITTPDAQTIVVQPFDKGVMDAEAFSLCEANKLPIIVLSMSEKGAVKKAVLGQRIGTLVG